MNLKKIIFKWGELITLSVGVGMLIGNGMINFGQIVGFYKIYIQEFVRLMSS